MSMDETPGHSDDTAPLLPEHTTSLKTDPPPQSSRQYGRLFVFMLGTVVLGILGTMAYQYGHPKKPATDVVVSSPAPATQPWDELQAQIQELREAQQAMSQQITNHHQQIDHLIQASPAVPSQEVSIQQARYYLDLAQITAKWSQNSDTTIRLLQSADKILAETKYPNTASVRDAIAQDLTALADRPSVNIDEIASKMNTITQKIEQLRTYPFAVDTTKTQYQPTESTNWRDNLYDNMQQLRGLITIQHHDDAWLPPSLNRITWLRENIHMTLQQARLGLIEQNQSLFTSALQATADSIAAGFDPKDPTTAGVLQDLQALQSTKISYPVPSLHHYESFFESNRDSAPTTKGSS